MTITDQVQTIRALESRIEELEYERDNLTNAIAEHVEALGHEGNDATALADALGQIERLFAGHDLDGDFEGVAAKVQAAAWLLQFAGTDATKTEYFHAVLAGD